MLIWLVLLVVILFALVAALCDKMLRQLIHNFTPVSKVIHVQEPWYTEIVKGRKTVEGRTGPEKKYSKLIGSLVRITNGTNSVVCKLKKVRHYKDLATYIHTEGREYIAPHIESVYDTFIAYQSIVDNDGNAVFSPENINKEGGICALDLRLV